jgi:exonuclease III
MTSVNCLIWNVRGLNDRARRDTVHQVVQSCGPIIVCLQETKLALISDFDVLSILGQGYSYVYLAAQETRGGILVAWRSEMISVESHRILLHSVSVKFQADGEEAWWFSGIYGPHQDADKPAFLEELREVRSYCNGPWMLAGDFNMIYSSEVKNNNNVNRAMMGCFRRFVNEMELMEIPLIGRRYTWSNERDSPTLVKLDRVLCTTDWEDIYPDCVLHSHATEMSDHCPLILGLQDGVQGKKRFHFESFWVRLPGFMETVVTSWEEPVQPMCPLQCISFKLKRLTRALQAWSAKRVGHVKTQLSQAREVLHRLEVAQDSRSLSPGEEWLRNELKKLCLRLASLERTIARLRSRVKQLKDGDANTSFFHKQAAYRKRKNYIPKILDGDHMATSQEDKHKVLFDFYEQLLGTASIRTHALDLEFCHREGLDLSELDAPIIEHEV